MLHFLFSDPYVKQYPGNSLLSLISGLEAAWRLVENENWPLCQSGENTIYSSIYYGFLKWIQVRQIPICLETRKKEFVLGKEGNGNTPETFSTSPDTWDCRDSRPLPCCAAQRAVPLRRISKVHHKAALLFSLCFHFISVSSFWEWHSVCVWVITTNNSHFDIWGMEANSFPDPKDTCFWYPADLIYKQEGLCLLFPPPNKQTEWNC